MRKVICISKFFLFRKAIFDHQPVPLCQHVPKVSNISPGIPTVSVLALGDGVAGAGARVLGVALDDFLPQHGGKNIDEIFFDLLVVVACQQVLLYSYSCILSTRPTRKSLSG